MMSPIEILRNCYLWRLNNDKSGNLPPWEDVEALVSPDQMDTVSIALNAMTAYADQECGYVEAENEELKKQVSALRQALETQNMENQPYIKELEGYVKRARLLLGTASIILSDRPDTKFMADTKKFLTDTKRHRRR